LNENIRLRCSEILSFQKSFEHLEGLVRRCLRDFVSPTSDGDEG